MDYLNLPLDLDFNEIGYCEGIFFEPSMSRDLDCQVRRDYDIRLNLNPGNEVENLSLIQSQKR
jgi:hypothetical protein